MEDDNVQGRGSQHVVFKHRVFSPTQISKINTMTLDKAGANSVQYNLKAGNTLKWFAHTFTGKGGRKSCVFAAWVGPNREPIRPWKTKDGRPPQLVLSFPPGPTRWIGLEIADCYKYEADKNDNKAQKIAFQSDEDSIDKDLYQEWYTCVKYVDKVMNEDRVLFLAENIDSHEMLSGMEREIGAKSTERLYDQLMMALRTSGNNTHHAFNAFAPKRKIYRDGMRDEKGAFVAGVTKEDKMTMAELKDEEGYVEHFLESKNGGKRLNLINMTLFDSSQLRPCEYVNIKGNDGCVAVEITFYGIYCRMEGGEAQQHSIMCGITSAQLFSNGKPANANTNAFDITSLLEEDGVQEEKTPVSAPSTYSVVKTEDAMFTSEECVAAAIKASNDEIKVKTEVSAEQDTHMDSIEEDAEDSQQKKSTSKRKSKTTPQQKRIKVRYEE